MKKGSPTLPKDPEARFNPSSVKSSSKIFGAGNQFQYKSGNYGSTSSTQSSNLAKQPLRKSGNVGPALNQSNSNGLKKGHI